MTNIKNYLLRDIESGSYQDHISHLHETISSEDYEPYKYPSRFIGEESKLELQQALLDNQVQSCIQNSLAVYLDNHFVDGATAEIVNQALQKSFQL